MSRLRSVVRIACVAGAAGLVFAAAGARAAAPPPTTAPPAAPPGNPDALPAFFGGVASVSGVFEHLDSTPPLAAVSNPIYASFGYGNSTYAADTLRAEAAPYNPGPTVVGLPGLICTAAGPPFCSLPTLSVSAIADASTPNATVNLVPAVAPGVAVPLTIGPLTGEAHVDPNNGVSTLAAVGLLEQSAGPDRTAASIRTLRSTLSAILGHPVAAASSALVHVSAIEGVTNQAFHGSSLVVHAEATDTGVQLLGGVVQIASIHTISETTADGINPPKHTESASIAGVSVAGVPATIDSKGIIIAGANIPPSVVKSVTDALNQALNAMGVTVQLMSHTASSVINPQYCKGGEADGLHIHATRDLTTSPVEPAVYYDDLLLGAACTTASVAASSASTSTGDNSSGPSTIGDQGGSSASSQFGGTNAATTPTGSPYTVNPAPSGPSSVALGPTSRPGTVAPGTVLPLLEAELRVHLAAFRIKALYLSFVLIGLAFLLGSPYLFPRRRKGVGNA